MESGRARQLTLVAMTLANSMILVDQTAVPLATPDVVFGLHGQLSEAPWLLTANILPLAAFMVLGGRLGDLFGLRRVFLAGALVFVTSSTLAGLAQDFPWMIAARAAQGAGAALMMPTALAIVSAVFPQEDRGRALGMLAGASAFFAALGPVLGGMLTSIDWRLVFLINVPLAITTILLTLRVTPALEPDPKADRRIDYPGVFTFALGMSLIVFGLSQAQDGDLTRPDVLIPVGIGIVSLVAFVLVEHRVANPLIEFRLFRHLNFLAANISQTVAGAVELGMGFLLPLYLLEVIGFTPLAAGLALIPATVPIIVAGPLSGRAFDKVGGRAPLVVGFLVLAASGVALALAAPEKEYLLMVPGLVLQGIGLGIVLTVNDPTGLTAVPRKDQGQAAGIINTTEQTGGALGIAGLTAFFLIYYWHHITEKLADRGIKITSQEIDEGRKFILDVEQHGLNQVEVPPKFQYVLDDIVDGHANAFEATYFAAAGLALLGALACLALVRRGDPVTEGKIFSRRSRWIYATSGRSSAITRRPDPEQHPGEN